MTMSDANFFLRSCQCRLDGNVLVVEAPTSFHARGLKRTATEVAAWGVRKAELLHRQIESIVVRSGDRSYEIPSYFADINQSDSVPTPDEVVREIEQNFRDVLDKYATMDLILEQHQEGHIVIITGHKSNICRYTSNRLTPKRAYWTPRQFDGYNYLTSWRETMNQYEELCDRLKSDHKVEGYKYELIRPDGARCWYETNYYLGIYEGELCRVGVSHPDAWGVVREAVLS